jgi:ribosome-associated protein
MTASSEAVALAIAAAEAASEKLGEDIMAIDVSDHVVITDVFVLISAANDRQVKGVVDGVEERLREMGAKPLRREGERESHWVLLDYGDIVVHVQLAEERIHYAIERLWKDCPMLELPASVNAPHSARDSSREAAYDGARSTNPWESS